MQGWYTHNKVPPTKYTASKHLELFPDRYLPIKEQYNCALKQPCMQDAREPYAQDRLGKGSIGKGREEKKTTTREKALALPDWLNKTKWADFEAMRKKMRKPLTEASIKLNLKVLETDKKNQAEIIDNAVRSSWQGLHPLKNNGSGKKPANHLAPEEGKYKEFDQ
jgi:hypothetical protein